MHIARVEGVLYAEKDFNLEKHPEMEGVPNLQARAWIMGQGRVRNSKLESSSARMGVIANQIEWQQGEDCDSGQGRREPHCP